MERMAAPTRGHARARLVHKQPRFHVRVPEQHNSPCSICSFVNGVLAHLGFRQFQTPHHRSLVELDPARQ
jgi:hypothetical protein